MHSTIPAKSPRSQDRSALRSQSGCGLIPVPIRKSPWASLVIPLLVAGLLSYARQSLSQTPSGAPASPTTTAHPSHKPSHARPSAAHPLDQPTAPATPALPQPEVPKWPVNEKADPASVVWDSHGLKIDATNSSLQQILADVSTETGAQVEGLDNDQRIFGSFGPGSARDVLAQLLEGSGYNFLMIGDQGQGTPRQIVLSARTTANSQQTAKPATPSDDDEVDEQPQQPQQPEGVPNRPGFPPRTQLDMQQREQMRLQQQQQQQGQQPGQPPNQQPVQPQQPATPPNQ